MPRAPLQSAGAGLSAAAAVERSPAEVEEPQGGVGPVRADADGHCGDRED